jgi:hypothetical protein
MYDYEEVRRRLKRNFHLTREIPLSAIQAAR